ncbi:MAG: hypothetical protein EOP83_21910, partial [Verrucomicrobiaceae bacterium]
MTGAFGPSIGDPVPSQAVSDFWIGIRGNNSLAWGGKTGTVSGATALGTKTGTISVNFTVTSFNAGATVGYEVFFNGTSKGSGTFTWSEASQNYIGIDGRDSSSVTVDNFAISTLPTFPNGDNSGSAVNGSGSVEAIVNGTLGHTTFTFSVSNGVPEVIASGNATVTQAAPPSPRPNVVVILVDDMGWGDLGCYGSEIPTPNIDSLAANGVRFRQFYQSARCSPTRCSILTGLYPQQAAVDPSAALPNLRNDNNVTFAELLGSDGYRTYHAGKWHLGGNALLPENRGFQHAWRFANGTAHSADCWNQSLYTFVS